MVTSIYKSIKAFLQDRPLKNGTMIKGKYEIVETLGMGSYGITYLVRDTRQQNKLYVLKQTKPSRRKDEKSKLSYHYETNILGTLNHPAIPKIHENFFFKDDFYFTMEFINGNTFEDLIFHKGKTYTENEAFQILQQLLVIVKYIHNENIVHRDLRIPNIIVVKNQLHLIDFGLARYIGDKPTVHAERLSDYMIEKQLKREVTFQSDFYSLGHFLLFLLYSDYTPSSKVERSWEEELPISKFSKEILRKMLQIKEPYHHIDELIHAVNHRLKIFDNNM
ncbi:serine/threonine protein kinase [Bacillus taeanensis]|uniref:Serine/threonine protein kinase n=1 Tax=Bacillus taeanensis TaxID=273032 RepID=A0A366XS47_9BACI|nr:protein kinase [Bacillus taeanensis]RBW69200.1 serine/threonine protein kinase [Bacillus taeanensis]